jgi:hypothetical protein
MTLAHRYVCAGPGTTDQPCHPDIAANAPWLDITQIAVPRIDRHTLCFALTLAAPPQADSSYGFGIIHELRGAEEGTSFDLAIDGVGHSHPLQADRGTLGTPRVAPALPRYGLVGDRREFAVASPRRLTSGLSLLIRASSESLQPDEPLLSHPLNAGDLIVPARGCLKFPAGGISLAGTCSNEPGP